MPPSAKPPSLFTAEREQAPRNHRPLDLAADLSEQKNVDHVIRFYLLGTHDAIERGGVTKKEV